MNPDVLTDQTTTFRIRGMVCARCVEAVQTVFEQFKLPVLSVSLGHVVVQGIVSPEQETLLRSALEVQGFTVLTDPKTALVQRIKEAVEDVLSRDDLGEQTTRYSEQISKRLGMSYDTLSALFSAQEGITLEKYVISRRLDKIKELLVYTDLTLADIAYCTGFSSVPHLSNQFKKLTGFSPSHFRDIRRDKQQLQRSIVEPAH
ncbi:helix-turn-helix domain-containing protein [Fibrella sp. HMF5335]|uniref:Helix-turn-helix domain-containing protein n=1 Tax=Fibrella rubiginis TaxID=2817060 RepID=A0A939GM73_9BACT|nr:helix-turn-helix domain-containing protein [Fibrella rubiginis]MBO0939336.1 helix-turn-helix domain-containing protein [Fibrella rubiginis]